MVKNINERQLNILTSVYSFRTLSYSQIYRFLFKNNGLAESYCDKNIKLLVSNNLLEKVGTRKENIYYFLTQKGINLLRRNNIDAPMPSFKLKIKENNIKHQLNLNQFVLEFTEKFPDCDYEYFDEIFVSAIFPNVRPDGILKIGNVCYFLEMDMNTERKQSLKTKWEHYRNFLNSSTFSDRDYEIKVLFILENVGENTKRKQNLQSYILEFLSDKIDNNFNIYIDTPSNLFEFLTKELSSSSSKDIIRDYFLDFNFAMSKKNFTNEALMNFSFARYVYMIDEKRDIVKKGNIPMEYIVDDFSNNDLYTLRKLEKFPQLSSAFKLSTKRDLKYILIVKSEEEIYKTIKKHNLMFEDVYFTTLQRLENNQKDKENKEYDAPLFRIDQLGQIYREENGVKVVERKIKSKI